MWNSVSVLSVSMLLTLSVFQCGEVHAAAPPATADSAQPLHEQLLDTLKANRGVRTAIPGGAHPVQATYNPEAIIPPQCYTRTEGQFNPCYVCHQNAIPGRENSMNDGALQLAYSFSEVGMSNHWQNLFEDRSVAVARISDQEILRYIDQDNYSALPERLESNGFEGFVPDLKNLHLGGAAFDSEGVALDGSHWVAFNYKPMPSTFWPTNGATDDVMIRLPEVFRENAAGVYSRDVYLANLSLLEATVKGLDSISTPALDERQIGRDLNLDGELGIVTRISAVDGYVGAAESAYRDTYVYPKGTEFLHTVRYVGVGPEGEIGPSRRMKEVRYMRKWRDFDKAIYARNYQLEGYAKEAGQLPQYAYLGDHGLDNGFGWSLSGFIENGEGDLRIATYEETLFCMGCHTSIGATIDKTFSFPRKVDGAAGWGYINLRGMPDAPNRGEPEGEIATYLERIGGGGEFRSNSEMRDRWFRSDGSLDHSKVSEAADVYELITPSPQRALTLNKTYRVIVMEQDFLYGRDASVLAPENVYRQIDNETAPTLPADAFHDWDIRLDWPASRHESLTAD